MARVKRMERVVALTKQLVDHPYQLFSFTYFCKKFEVAKSTLSEDVLAVRAGLEAYDLGRVGWRCRRSAFYSMSFRKS